MKQYYKPGEVALRDKPLYDLEISGDEKLPKQEDIISKPISGSVSKPKTAPPQPYQGKKALATPPVRKLAQELGIDIGSLQGTGKNGHITIEDVKNYTKVSTDASIEKQVQLPGDEIIPLVGIRNLMAKKMKESKEKIPHFSYFEQVDASRLVQLRHNLKEQADQENLHLTYMPFFIKAFSLTINKFPVVNGMLDPQTNSLVLHKKQNIGIAISTKLGLIVPVLKDVESLSLAQIIKGFEELKKKASEGKLSPNDFKDSTVTISNFGVFSSGGLWATPIINYPEVAILAVARIQKQPIVKNDEVIARDTLNLSWSFDHRVIDGDYCSFHLPLFQFINP